MHYKINDQMTSENIALLYLEMLDQNINLFIVKIKEILKRNYCVSLTLHLTNRQIVITW